MPYQLVSTQTEDPQRKMPPTSLGWVANRRRFRDSFTTPDTLLHACIRDGNLSLLEKLTSNIPVHQLRRLTSEGSSPLHFAVFIDSLPAVKILLAAGADPWLRDDAKYFGDWPRYMTPLLLALIKGHREVMSCIWHSVGPRFPASDEANYVLYAVCIGSPGIVQDVLTWREDWKELYLGDALEIAAGTWNPRVLSILLRCKPGGYNQRALTRALTKATRLQVEYIHQHFLRTNGDANGPLEQAITIEILIKAGADPDVSVDEGKSPLYAVAGIRESTPAMKTLLENGADPNLVLYNGQTVLHTLASAVQCYPGNQDARSLTEASIRLLLKHGARPLERGKDGTTPLHVIFEKSDRYHAEILLSYCPGPLEVTLRVKNDLDETLMHFAALGARYSLLEWLIAQGLDLNQRNHLGWTPLMCALAPDSRPCGPIDSDGKTISASVQAARLLVSHGADVEVTANDGWSPLHALGLHSDLRVHADAADFAQDLLNRTAKMDTPRPITFPWHGMGQKNRTWDRPGREMPLLHWAAEHGCHSLIKALYECGVNVFARDSDGLTAAETAAVSIFFPGPQNPQKKSIIEMLWEQEPYYESDETMA